MDGESVSDINEIVSAINNRLESSKRLLIAIDGRGGAGKSSLARSLVSELEGASLIEFDWFHLPKARVTATERFDRHRFVTEVVSPFRSGASGLTIFRYNWGYLRDVEDGIDLNPAIVPLKQVLVVEGCQTLQRNLCNEYDLRIWVEVEAAECLRRGMRRDIDEYKLEPVKVMELWKEWAAWENEMLLRERLKDNADIIYLPLCNDP